MEKKLCVTYLRVSTEDQRIEQTIETQRDAIKEYCVREGFVVEKEFTDEAKSGALPVDSRDGFLSLFVYLESNNQIKDVVVYDVSRVARDLYVAMSAKRRAESSGVLFHYVNAPNSGNQIIDDLTHNILSSFAEFDRKMITTRMLAGRLRKAKSENKVYMSKHITLGYDMVENKLVINPVEAKTVRFIFENYLKGYSTDNIGIMLANNNMYSKTLNIWKETDDCMPELVGKPKWQRGSVAFVLHNSTYKGIFEYNQKGHDTVYVRVPPIVTEGEFDTVQARLKTGLKQSPRSRKHEYTYKGLLKCGVCGRDFHCLTTTRNGKTYANYRCASVNTPEIKPCGNRSITEGKLDSVIMPILKERWEKTKKSSFKKLYEQVVELRENAQKEYAEKQAELKKEATALDIKTKRLVEIYTEGLIEKAIFISKKESLDKERKRLDNKMLSLKESLDEQGKTLIKPKTDFNKAFYKAMKISEKETRESFNKPDTIFKEMQIWTCGLKEIIVNKDNLLVKGTMAKTNPQNTSKNDTQLSKISD